ncbi:hypothetical protein BN946_scf184840.g12 [Trametes cinnabarina]|uniref:Uncharacterized protein n=1 Tax=Pycnoporus cinnabarinus TaxID=5643 RepID=A0A060STR6_PYCCI|nr:hypothetical protein BN946_scf184840.g12 [Trametes cinnabarina]
MTTLLAPIAEQNVGPISGVDEDVEPDSQWKEALRSRIEQGLQSMVDKVRQERDTGLRGLREGTREYDNVMKAYQISMDRVRRIAEDQFNQELKIARFERSLALGKEIEGEEFEAFRRQQQAIWDKIKKDGAERPQARQDSTVVGRPTHENGDPLAVPPKANSGEHDAREGPSTPYRESRPPVRVPGATEYRPRDRTQSGGSEQVPGTPGSYGGSRPPRSRGNSSVLAADVEGPPPSGPGPYDHGSIGRQGLSSLSRTRPQDIWLPPQAPKESPVSATSRTFAHATAPNLSPISPNVVNEPHGRSVSRAGSMRSNERPSPLTDMEPGSSLPRDRFGMGSVDERMPARKGKEADRTDYPSYPQPQPQHQREPVPPQPTVYDYYARRPDSRISMPITPARPSMPAQSSDEPYFYQASLVPPARPRQNSEDRPEGMPVRSRSSRHSAASDQGSPENPRYMPQGLASARPIPSKRSFNGEYDPWPAQPPSASRPFYGTQSPPAPPSYAPSNSRPIPRPASTDDHPRRPSPSAPAYGSQSPPDVFPFAGYDVPFTSSSRHRFANSPAGSINGRRNSNGSRSVRSRSSRQEFWGPADLSQRPLQTFEEQSVASDSDSEDYGMDLEDLWHVRERQDLTWKLVKEQEANARRKEEEAERVREEARRKEEEARRIREEARLKEEKAARDREEARREAEEAKRKAEEAKRQAEEARRKEEDTKRREKELQMQALEYEKKMEELRAREAELMRREMESRLEEERRKRQEVETKLQEEIRRRQEAEEEARRKEEAEARRREREEAAERRRRQQEEADRLRRETEEAERRHRERKEREEWERKDRERREKEEQERREREEREWAGTTEEREEQGEAGPRGAGT